MLDTLKYSHKLEATGVPREQAEAQAQALQEALEQGELATKTDIRELELHLINRMYALHGATIAILFALFKLFG